MKYYSVCQISIKNVPFVDKNVWTVESMLARGWFKSNYLILQTRHVRSHFNFHTMFQQIDWSNWAKRKMSSEVWNSLLHKIYIYIYIRYNFFAYCIFAERIAVSSKEINVIKYRYVYFSKASIKCVRLASFKCQKCFHSKVCPSHK